MRKFFIILSIIAIAGLLWYFFRLFDKEKFEIAKPFFVGI
jgi:hypothetical protein